MIAHTFIVDDTPICFFTFIKRVGTVVNIEKGDGKGRLLLAGKSEMEFDQFHAAK